MLVKYNALIDKGKSLGGEISYGINWTWFRFPSKEAAIKFNSYCVLNNYETRGVYPPYKHDSTWGVRFR
jgi:hypothetical protein